MDLSRKMGSRIGDSYKLSVIDRSEAITICVLTGSILVKIPPPKDSNSSQRDIISGSRDCSMLSLMN